MTKIVHCKNPHTLYIGRPKTGQEWRFGNPFTIGIDGDRATVIDKMDQWLELRKTFGNKNATPEHREWILNHIDLITKDAILGCWCSYPEEDCHGRILIKHAEKRMKTLAIIGTAGRGPDYDKLNADIYKQMILAAEKVLKLEKITHLVSGGAAWADNIACEFPTTKIKLYIPSIPKDIETSRYYHRKFRAKVPDAAIFGKAEIIQGGGFLDRNLLVAAEADVFLAMTFGDKSEVKDGGTKHTVNAMLKQGKYGYHLDLNVLKLYPNAK